MQVFVGGGNAIFLLLTVLFTGFLALVALFAWRIRNRSIFRTATSVGVIVLGVYGALLVTAAIASKERVLSKGEVKWFCGFYLDCHLGVSVAKVESVKTLAGSHGPVTATGVFTVITLQFHNNARNLGLEMTLYNPRVALIDSHGTKYERSAQAEFVAVRRRTFAAPVNEELSVTHAPLFATVIFDVPSDVTNPKLSIEEGFIVGRIIELVLVNDDNSILHKPTLLALSATNARSPTSFLLDMENIFPRVHLASR